MFSRKTPIVQYVARRGAPKARPEDRMKPRQRRRFTADETGFAGVPDGAPLRAIRPYMFSRKTPIVQYVARRGAPKARPEDRMKPRQRRRFTADETGFTGVPNGAPLRALRPYELRLEYTKYRGGRGTPVAATRSARKTEREKGRALCS